MFTLPFSNFAMTKVCAALSCNNTSKDTKLTWHNLPKEEWLREQWIDLLGIKNNSSSDNKICSSHFKQNDFLNGRRSLKEGSVPVLHLAKSKNINKEIDDDVILLSSSDDEKSNRKSSKRLRERVNDKHRNNESTDSEEETDSNQKRRCRKAARLAVAKIAKTVQKYHLAENSYKEEKDNPFILPSIDSSLTKKKEPIIIIKPENNIDLMMECYEELLTQTQVEAYRKARVEYDSVLKKLYYLKVANAKITYCTDLSILPPDDSNNTVKSITESNASNSNISENLFPKSVSTPINNSLSLTKMPVVTETVIITPLTAPITPMSNLPSKTISNSTSVISSIESTSASLGSATTSTNATSVMPVLSVPNKSLSVNQMPLMLTQPQAPLQIVQTTPQQPTIFLTNPSTTTATTKPSITNTLLLPGKILNSNSCKIVVDSKTGTVLGTMTVDPLSGNSVCRVPESAVSGKTIQVLKVSNVAPQPVIPAVPVKLLSAVSQQQSGTTKVDDENIENSGESLLTDSSISIKETPEIKGGCRDFTMHAMLSLRPKVLCLSKNSFEKEKESLLKDLVKNGYFEKPVQWLLKMKIFPSQPLCKNCSMGFMQLIPDTGSLDGYKWMCRNHRCAKLTPVRRLLFFDKFGIPLGKLFALTYHWAIQSPVEKVLEEVEMDIYRLRTVWRAIQEICSKTVANAEKLGGIGNKVEIGAVRIGRLVVLGAFDRNTKATRLKAFPSVINWNSTVLAKSLEPWLQQGTQVISNIGSLNLNSKDYPHISSLQNIDNMNTITKYLLKKLHEAFGNYAVDQLRLINLQGFLDELQWRERYGQSVSLSFWNIFEHIIEQSGHTFKFKEKGEKGFPTTTLKIDKIPDFKNNKTNLTKSKRKYNKRSRKIFKFSSDSEDYYTSSDDELVPVTTNDTVKDSPEYHDNSKDEQNTKICQEDVVALEEFYYARKNASKKLLKAEYKGNFQFKCLICKKIVENNIKVMKHINAHIDNQRQCKPALSDLTQCKYCFRDFETPFSMQCHIEAVHLKKDSLVCRICNQEFVQFRKLSLHMKNLHVQFEMPYSCQLCRYRSSFHQDVIEHFHETHYGTDKVLCHYCLKVFHIKFSNVGLGFIQNYFYHLHKHQLKSATKKCSSCCLIFLSAQELREHRSRAHRSMVEQKGVEAIKSTFVAPPEELLEEKSNKTYPASVVTSTKCEIISEKPVKSLSNKVQDITIENLNMPTFKCCECGRPMTLRHFGRFLTCGSCRYSTNCCKAFVDHMILKHSKLKRTGKNMAMDPKPTILKQPMGCACGFTSLDGNSIATHLVNCRKLSCQITSTKSMITVIKHAADGYWHIDKSFKERKSYRSLLKINKIGKISELPKSTENIELETETKNNGKEKNQNQGKQNGIASKKIDDDINLEITEVTSSALKIMRNEDKQMNSSNNVENISQNKLEHSEVKETEESSNMLNALGLVRRSISNTSDSVDTSKDTTEDAKLDSLYCEVEETNTLANSWEEIEIVDD